MEFFLTHKTLQTLLDQYPNTPARAIILELMLTQMSKLFNPAYMEPDDLKAGLLDLVKIPEKASRIDSEPLSGVEPTPYPNADVTDAEIPF